MTINEIHNGGTLEISGNGTKELGTDNQILENVGEDAHQFYEHSQSVGESSDKENEQVLMKHNDYEDNHSIKEHSNDRIMIPIAQQSNRNLRRAILCFEACKVQQ